VDAFGRMSAEEQTALFAKLMAKAKAGVMTPETANTGSSGTASKEGSEFSDLEKITLSMADGAA